MTTILGARLLRELRQMCLETVVEPRDAPPGLTSIVIVDTGVVNGGVPNHCAKCSGSVNAFQTSSRGASKTRVTCVSFIVAPVVGVVRCDSPTAMTTSVEETHRSMSF